VLPLSGHAPLFEEYSMPDPSFTDRELDVMAILWELGNGTVPEVRERLSDDLAYTTVQSVLRTLESKGYVGHDEEGRFHRYRPLVAKEDAGKSVLRRVMSKLFAGSPELLLSQLVAQRGVTDDQVRRMRKLLDARLRKEG
jgi:BlaI family transcriptional regulator, penicillinase repressor